jgi:uncharacterized BrkB/YihY/UPF0761 family membrane protein
MIYKLLPDTSIRWGDVWIGASITSLLFTIGKFLIGLYFGKSNVGVAYGTAGSLIVILIWVYYACRYFYSALSSRPCIQNLITPRKRHPMLNIRGHIGR